MPKIRTHEVVYTITPNRHRANVAIMYDVNVKLFYVAIPDDFNDCITSMPDALKEKYNIKYVRGIRGIYGEAIIHEQESELITGLEGLFHYCGNAIKSVRNVIIVYSNSQSHSDTEKWRNMGCNRERFKLKQDFCFDLAVETKVGEGKAIYTYQGVTYTNTIGYNEKSIIIDDTPENRAFLEDVYSRFDTLIVNLKNFFSSSETVLQLITSNQKLLN
jgi:hypothetical protein